VSKAEEEEDAAAGRKRSARKAKPKREGTGNNTADE